jgi:hypothetical protein
MYWECTSSMRAIADETYIIDPNFEAIERHDELLLFS